MGGYFTGYPRVVFPSSNVNQSSQLMVIGDVDFTLAMSIRGTLGRSKVNLLSMYGSHGRLTVDAIYGDLVCTTNASASIGNSTIYMGTLDADIINDGTIWTYLALVYSLGDHTLRLYADGQLMNSISIIFGFRDLVQMATLSSQEAPFLGWIARFHYFSGALSVYQVQQLLSYSGWLWLNRTKLKLI